MPPPRPTPQSVRAPGRVSSECQARLPSDPQLTRLLQFSGCAQSPYSGLRSMCSSVPTLPFMSLCGCVVPCCWPCLSLHLFVLGSPPGWVPTWGVLRVAPCLPSPGRRPVAPNCCFLTVPRLIPPIQIQGAIGVHVSVVCVCMWREWILSTFRGKPFWEMVGSIGSLAATHSCRAERECQTQRSIFLNHEGVSGWLPKSLAAWRPLPGPAPPQPA